MAKKAPTKKDEKYSSKEDKKGMKEDKKLPPFTMKGGKGGKKGGGGKSC